MVLVWPRLTPFHRHPLTPRDLHWSSSIHVDADSGCSHAAGGKAFSEPETRGVRDVLQAYVPHMFVSVHSGALSMFTPHAYDTLEPTTGAQGRYERQMLDMLRTVNAKAGVCPYGAAGKELGYTCSGNCLDYAFEAVKVPYSFAFEIYTPDKKAAISEWHQHQRAMRLKSRRAGVDQSLLELGTQDLQPFTPSSGSSCFLESSSSSSSSSRSARRSDAEVGTGVAAGVAATAHHHSDAAATLSATECLRYFNPVDPTAYRATLTEWTGRTLHLSELVAEHYAGVQQGL